MKFKIGDKVKVINLNGMFGNYYEEKYKYIIGSKSIIESISWFGFLKIKLINGLNVSKLNIEKI